MKLYPLILAAFSLLLFGCANQLPPGGGLVDTIPPEVIDSYPKNGTTEFVDDHLEFTFSEYVDKRTVKDAVLFHLQLREILNLNGQEELLQ